MKSVIAAAASSAVLVVAGSAAYVRPSQQRRNRLLYRRLRPRAAPSRDRPPHDRHAPRTAVSNEALTTVVQADLRRLPQRAHQKPAISSSQNFDVATAASNAETSEKMIAKLRAA